MARRRTQFRAWLEDSGLRQSDLAKELGASDQRINNYLEGVNVPRPEMLRKLMDRTGLPFDAFLFPFHGKRTV